MKLYFDWTRTPERTLFSFLVQSESWLEQECVWADFSTIPYNNTNSRGKHTAYFVWVFRKVIGHIHGLILQKYFPIFSNELLFKYKKVNYEYESKTKGNRY